MVLALAVLVTAAGAPALAERAEGSFQRTLKVTGPVVLSVKTGSGNITVKTGSANTVAVRATIKARDSRRGGMSAAEKVRELEQNPPIIQNGNTIEIGGLEDRDRHLRRNVSISYELIVPQQTRLKSSTGSGDQTIGGLAGPVSSATGSGEITVASIGDEVRVTTGSGNITLESINGSVQATSGSGDIRAEGIAGGMRATNGSGDVWLAQTAAGDTKITTGSGRVEATGVNGGLTVVTGSGRVSVEGNPSDTWKLRTSSGGIRVHLPESASFDVFAKSDSGSIDTSHPITVEGTLKRGRLQGKVRGGGVLIDLRAGSGNIRIE